MSCRRLILYLAVTAISAGCGNEPFRPETVPAPGVTVEYLTPYTPIAGKPFSSGVVVFVRDEQSRGRFKVPVRFQPGPNSGYVSANTVLTDQFGKAHVDWTLDQIVGVNTLDIFVDTVHRQLKVTSIVGPDTVSRAMAGE